MWPDVIVSDFLGYQKEGVRSTLSPQTFSESTSLVQTNRLLVELLADQP